MKSAFEAAEQYFEEAAAVMNLTSSMRDLLLIPARLRKGGTEEDDTEGSRPAARR